MVVGACGSRNMILCAERSLTHHEWFDTPTRAAAQVGSSYPTFILLPFNAPPHSFVPRQQAAGCWRRASPPQHQKGTALRWRCKWWHSVAHSQTPATYKSTRRCVYHLSVCENLAATITRVVLIHSPRKPSACRQVDFVKSAGMLKGIIEKGASSDTTLHWNRVLAALDALANTVSTGGASPGAAGTIAARPVDAAGPLAAGAIKSRGFTAGGVLDGFPGGPVVAVVALLLLFLVFLLLTSVWSLRRSTSRLEAHVASLVEQLDKLYGLQARVLLQQQQPAGESAPAQSILPHQDL